jgi:hypothetical protein
MGLNPGVTSASWHGSAVDPTGSGQFPNGLPAYGPGTEPTCATNTCDAMHLDVAFPEGYFQPGDGILVSIAWPTDFDQWNLYVYDPGGALAGEGVQVDSNSQAVLVSPVKNGEYTVQVVPFYTQFDYSTDAAPNSQPDTSYRGFAGVYRAPAAGYLPELRTAPPSDFHTADVPPLPSNPTGWRWTSNGTFANSCYLDEQPVPQLGIPGSTRCLRFDNDIQNIGQGPLILQFAYDRGAFDNTLTGTPPVLGEDCEMTQIIPTATGESQHPAGDCVFHVQHMHFHYQHFASYELWSVDPSTGAPLARVATGKKVGFCLIDVDNWAFGEAGDQPRSYTFPTCNIPNNPSTLPASITERMGISPGWGDVYTWDLPTQYIDISSLPASTDGYFEVIARANPDGMLAVAGTSQETGVTCIHLNLALAEGVDWKAALPSQDGAASPPSCPLPASPPS